MRSKEKNVLLIHGWGGKKKKHWLTWLEKELLNRHYTVSFPKIPNSYNPKCQKWVDFLHLHLTNFKPDIVIAHSLGALAWWHFYATKHFEVAQVIVVSPPTFASFPSKMSSFFPLPDITFDTNIQTIICAQDDPNISIKNLKELAIQMNSRCIEKKEGEHLDHFSKVYELKEALEIIA